MPQEYVIATILAGFNRSLWSQPLRHQRESSAAIQTWLPAPARADERIAGVFDSAISRSKRSALTLVLGEAVVRLAKITSAVHKDHGSGLGAYPVHEMASI